MTPKEESKLLNRAAIFYILLMILVAGIYSYPWNGSIEIGELDIYFLILAAIVIILPKILK